MREASEVARHDVADVIRRSGAMLALDEAGAMQRTGLNADLTFSPRDRSENIRRIGEVASLFADAGMIAITAFISPCRADRQRARDAAKDASHDVKADVSTCEGRDPNKRARRGEIPEFTGTKRPSSWPTPRSS